MRKVVLVVNMTVDGHLSGPRGELDWMIGDHVLGQEFGDEVMARTDTILSGRNAHLGFEDFFGGLAADPKTPEGLAEFARWMVETPTVVFSKTLTEVRDGARIAGDIAATVAELKARDGKDMVVFGGVETARAFVQLGLVDEYWFKVHPVVIGAGKALFEGRAQRGSLRLIEAKAYESGMASLRYAA